MSAPKIVLTGATGGLGSAVLKHLLALSLVPPNALTLSLHNPAGLPPSLSPHNLPIVRGDFTAPASLDAAFAGAARLLIVSYPGISRDTRFAAHKNAIDAAVRARVQHVWYTSLGFGAGGDASVTAVMAAHLDTEAYLKQSGLTYTILREGIYSESYPLYLGFWSPAESTDDIYVPGDGPISWVSRDELGEATARLIAEGSHPNETLLLTGPSGPTLAALTHTLSTLLSRPLALHTIPAPDWIARNASDAPDADWRHTPAFLELWASTYPGLAAGEAGLVTRTMEEVLGRAPKSMEQVLREMLQLGGGDGGAIEQYAK